MEIKIVRTLHWEQWNEFCRQNGGNIFQSPHFARICKTAQGYRPFPFFAVANQKVLASILLMEVKTYPAAFNRVSNRLVVFGGPLWEDSPRGREAILRLFDYVRARASLPACLFLEVRNFQDTSSLRPDLEKLGYQYVEYLNYLIDLQPDLEQIWQRMSKEKRRKIRKADRFGLAFREGTSLRDVEKFYQLLHHRYRALGVPLAHISLFSGAFQRMVEGGFLKLYLVEYRGQPISAVAILLYNGVAYEWYAASDSAYHHMRPNDWRVWQSLRVLKSLGIRQFDFCGAGYPDQPYGVREFKKHFGGQEVNYGRYLYLPRPRLFALMNQLYSWKQKMARWMR